MHGGVHAEHTECLEWHARGWGMCDAAVVEHGPGLVHLRTLIWDVVLAADFASGVKQSQTLRQASMHACWLCAYLVPAAKLFCAPSAALMRAFHSATTFPA